MINLGNWVNNINNLDNTDPLVFKIVAFWILGEGSFIYFTISFCLRDVFLKFLNCQYGSRAKGTILASNDKRVLAKI